MGMDKEIILGPYMECVNEEVKFHDGFEKFCMNKSCRKQGRVATGDYCYLCGEKHIEYPRETISSKIDPWKVTELTKDALFVKSTDNTRDWYLPNQYRDRKRSFNMSQEKVLEITLEIINEELDWFKEAFKQEISQVQEIYGKDNVAIKWGYVSYYS